VSGKSCQKVLLYDKFGRLMLMKLTADGRAKCDMCDTIFDSFKKLCLHRPKVCEHRRMFANPTCPICGIKFKEPGYLRRHVSEKHLKEKPFKCERCDKAFSRHITLESHINIVHDKIKNYKCDECDVTSGSRFTLERHIREVHNHEKRHECPSCHKLFARKVTLEMHFDSVHMGSKIHPCLICSKLFKRKYYATYHMRKIHSYVSDIRGLGTWLNDNLKDSEE